MSKKEEVRALLSDGRDRFEDSASDEFGPAHLQIRQYHDVLEGDNSTTCTYDWYNELALQAGNLASYVCSFVDAVEGGTVYSLMASSIPQKPNPYYFTKCGKCGYIILTNRDIGKKLVCTSPRAQCSYENHTQPIPNDALMTDVLELVNEYFELSPS